MGPVGSADPLGICLRRQGVQTQEYGKVMWMATSAYFEFIFGRYPIYGKFFIVIVVLCFSTPKFSYMTQNGVVAAIGAVRKFF